MTRYFDDSQYALPVIHKCCGSHSGKHRKGCLDNPQPVVHECCASKAYKHKKSCIKAKESEKITTEKIDYECPVCSRPQHINFNHEKILRLKESEHFFQARIKNLVWQTKVLETVIRKKGVEIEKLDALFANIEKTNKNIKHVALWLEKAMRQKA